MANRKRRPFNPDTTFPGTSALGLHGRGFLARDDSFLYPPLLLALWLSDSYYDYFQWKVTFSLRISRITPDAGENLSQ